MTSCKISKRLQSSKSKIKGENINNFLACAQTLGPLGRRGWKVSLPLLPGGPKVCTQATIFENHNFLKELCHAGDWFREQSLDKGKELESRLFELSA